MVTNAILMTMRVIPKSRPAAAPRMVRGAATLIPAGEFKAKCLGLLDDVESRHHTIVVTKRGRPVARVVPLTMGAAGSLRGSLIHEEDLLSPVNAIWEDA